MDGQIVFHFALNNKLNYFCNYVKFGCMEQRLHVLTKLGSNIKLAGQVIGLGTPSTQKQNLSQTYFEQKKMQLENFEDIAKCKLFFRNHKQPLNLPRLYQ